MSTARNEGLAQRVDWDAAVPDGAAAVRALQQRDDLTGEVGVVGFCFGGGLAFNVAAVEPVAALVSYGRQRGRSDAVGSARAGGDGSS